MQWNWSCAGRRDRSSSVMHWLKGGKLAAVLGPNPGLVVLQTLNKPSWEDIVVLTAPPGTGAASLCEQGLKATQDFQVGTGT